MTENTPPYDPYHDPSWLRKVPAVPAPPPAWDPQQGQLASSAPPAPPAAPRKRWGKAGGGAAAAGGVAAKAGLLAKFFLAFKSVAILAKFKFALSMLVSVVAYSFIFGWLFAVGFVILLAVHEFGHVVVLRAQGVKATLPTFVPFMGAFVKVQSRQQSVAHEAASALAGPVAGTLGAIATLELSHVFNSQLLRALAYTAFFLNLFNLLPALPLDGGRVAGALHPVLWFVGLGGALVYEFIHPSIILPFILLLGVLEIGRRWKSGRLVDPSYYAIPKGVRVAIGTAYLSVAAICLWGMDVAYVRR
jgi:Zn-dependent protease